MAGFGNMFQNVIDNAETQLQEQGPRYPEALQERYNRAQEAISGYNYAGAIDANVEAFQQEARKKAVEIFDGIAGGKLDESQTKLALMEMEALTSDSNLKENPAFTAWAPDGLTKAYDRLGAQGRTNLTKTHQALAGEGLSESERRLVQGELDNITRSFPKSLEPNAAALDSRGWKYDPEDSYLQGVTTLESVPPWASPAGIAEAWSKADPAVAEHFSNRTGVAPSGSAAAPTQPVTTASGIQPTNTLGAVKDILDGAEGPQYQTDFERVKHIDPRSQREIRPDEQVSTEAVDKMRSSFGDDIFGFTDKLDPEGIQAQKDAIAYYRQLVAGGGKDAVADASYERASQEADQQRNAALDSAIRQLDTQGLAGSGAEMQARLQTSGQSMQAKYNAGLERAAMEQQRRDQAAGAMGQFGAGLRSQQFGEALQTGQAIDQLTSQREHLRAQIEDINAGRKYASREEYEQYRRNLGQLNTQIDQWNATWGNSEKVAQNRFQESQSDLAKRLQVAAASQDASTLVQILMQQKGLDQQNAQAQAQALMNMSTVQLQNEAMRIANAQATQGPSQWDVISGLAPAALSTAGTVVGSMYGGPAGGAAGGAVGSAVGKAITTPEYQVQTPGQIQVPNLNLSMPALGNSKYGGGGL